MEGDGEAGTVVDDDDGGDDGDDGDDGDEGCQRKTAVSFNKEVPASRR